jgi:predicted aminopeptidase
LFWDEAALARLIFHEMAHSAVFVPGDTAFNESFATAVERLGLKRWTTLTGRVEPLKAAQAREAQSASQSVALKALREDLRAIYQSALSLEDRRQAKAQALERFKQQYPQISPELTNNAALALQGSYQDAAPAFERLFEAQGRDFVKFYEAARRLSGLPAVLGAVTP